MASGGVSPLMVDTVSDCLKYQRVYISLALLKYHLPES